LSILNKQEDNESNLNHLIDVSKQKGITVSDYRPQHNGECSVSNQDPANNSLYLNQLRHVETCHQKQIPNAVEQEEHWKKTHRQPFRESEREVVKGCRHNQHNNPYL